MLRNIIAASILLASMGLARAEGLTPAGAATQGLCFASGASGPQVPCVLQGRTWTRVLQPTDDASGMGVAATGGGVPRPQGDRATDLVSILDYGAKGDWSSTTGVGTDTVSALGKALAVANGRCVHLPPGNYFFASTPPPITSRPVCMIGAGPQMTRIVFGPAATNGLVVHQKDITDSVVFRGLSFMAMAQEAGDALTVTWTEADVLLIPGSPHGVFEDLHFGAYLFDTAKYGWRRGLNLTNALYPTIRDIFCMGRTTKTGPRGTQVAADLQHQTDCILLQAGAFDIVAGFLRGIRAYNVVNGIRLSAPATTPGAGYEGLNVAQYDCAGCGYGVKLDVAVGGVGVTLADGHLNVLHAGIAGNIGPDAQISNWLIYKTPLANSATTCLDLNGALNASIANINCKNQTSNAAVSGDFIGLRLANSSSAHCSSIYIERPTIGVLLENGTAISSVGPTAATGGVSCDNVVTAGTFANATGGTRAVVDNTGNGSNYVGGGRSYQINTNPSAIAAPSSGGFAVSSTAMNVAAGQRYRVTVQVAMTNGATAGDMVTSLIKTGGTATATFGPNGRQLNQRQQVGVNQSAIQNFSGVLTITGTGSLNLSALVQSTGSTGTVPAHGAMLTVEGM